MLTYFDFSRREKISRRGLVGGAAGWLGCGRRKGSRFPGYAFVANAEGRSVAAVDLAAFAVSRQIPVEAAPSAVVAHPSKPLVYVLAPGAGLVYEIEAPGLRIRRKARVGGPAVSMRLAPDGSALWVLERRALVGISLAGLDLERRIPLAAGASDFDLSRDGRAAIAFPKERELGLLGLNTGALEHRVHLEAEPAIVRFQSDGRQALVGTAADRTLTIVEVQTGKVVVRLPLPVEPQQFCFNADQGQLFVTGPGMDTVVIVFPFQTEVGESILAGRAPDAMAVSRVPPYLFVANPQTASVTVLDIDTRRLVSVVAVGEEPHHIAITPDNQYALVLNRRSGDMAVIRIAALDAAWSRRYKMAPLFTMIPVGPKPVSAAVVAV